MFDSAALILLILSVFKFELNKINCFKLLVSSFIFSVLSLVIINLQLHNFAIAIQIPIVILIFKFVFNENGKYSIWISITGYITFLMMQGIFASILILNDCMTPEDLQPFSEKGYIAQVSSLVFVIIISYLIKKYNEGFTFNFTSKFKQKRKLSSSRPYIIVAVLAALITAIVYPFLYKSDLIVMFISSLVLTVICFFSLIFLSIKRNKEEIICVL
ncbi:hypothetical protein BK127_40605 [Paenibacillus sp. FSL H7-0331]|nr:hypothetical protein BK127_40605 [Paenibacillus sp. FSL H7-0331]